MKTIIADFKVMPNKLEQFLSLAKELHSKTLTEEGNVSYIFCKKPDSTYDFAFFEVWHDDLAIEKHNRSEHFTRLIPQMVELCEGEPIVQMYEVYNFEAD
ncbi:MAG TPA: antibiotic biosynthesis monooxygenase [Clostridiaceae bacterium]|nr:antibiotic biosynthesis monooxygenase [Clostridiaceae bacterium]